MRAIDTNVLIRIITPDHPQQTAAARNFIAPGAWVSTLTLVEAMWVLESVYGLVPKEQIKALEMLLQHRDLVIQDHEAVKAALDLFRARPALGFSDCLIVATAHKAGHLPLGTFDRKLDKVDGAVAI